MESPYERSQRTLLLVSAVLVGTFMVYFMNQPMPEGPVGLTEREAKRATPMSFTDCSNAGIVPEEGDFYLNEGELLWQGKRLDKESIVFIVGGRDGWLAEQLYKKYGSQIFIFEGMKTVFDTLDEKFAHNKNVRVFNYRLGKADAEVKIDYGSLADPSELTSDTTDTSVSLADGEVGEIIQVKQLSNVIQMLGIHQVKFIHMDCDGCEYDLMEFIADTSNRIEELQVAFSPEGEGVVFRYCSLQQSLAKEFKLAYRYPWVFESWVRRVEV